MTALVRAASAEWVKLRSLRSTWYFLVGALIVMVLVSALDADGTRTDLRAGHGVPGSIEVTASAVETTAWVHFVLGALAMLVITSEYATRSILGTLSATPSRTRLLLAKVAVVIVVSVPVAVLITIPAVLVSRPLLAEFGHTDAGQIVARIAEIAIYLTLVDVLALGLGTLIRRTAGTLTVLFLLLTVVPPILQTLGLRTLADYTPGAAGTRLMAGNWLFALVLAGWSAAAVTLGWWALRTRDA